MICPECDDPDAYGGRIMAATQTAPAECVVCRAKRNGFGRADGLPGTRCIAPCGCQCTQCCAKRSFGASGHSLTGRASKPDEGRS